MTLKLSEICASVLRIAVARGEISNASNWPVVLRRLMFEWFRIKRQLYDEKVLQLLCQPGFFDGFSTINLHQGELHKWNLLCYSPVDRDSSSGRSLASAVTIFKKVPNLAENITDLCLGASRLTDRYRKENDNSPATEQLVHLLGLCKNLKRLQLVGTGLTNGCFLARLQMFAESADVSFPALEHLSLISFTGDLTGTLFPRRLFESLQSLQIRSIDCDDGIYSYILSCCQNTLTCLDVVDDQRPYCNVSPVPIKMPKLSTLSFTKYGRAGPKIKFDDIVEHCPNLTAATLRISGNMVSETDLSTLVNLSKRVRLSIELDANLCNISKFVEAVGECIFALSLDYFGYDGRDCDNILSNTPNLSYLHIKYLCMFPDTMLFENHFADKARAERLIQFHCSVALSSTALKFLFTNCLNLLYLSLNLESYSEDISNYLETWVENGARPVFVVCPTLVPLEPRTVCSLLKASGRELNRLTLTVRLTEEKIDEMILNVLRNHCPFLQDGLIKFRVPSPSLGRDRTLFVNGSRAQTFNNVTHMI